MTTRLGKAAPDSPSRPDRPGEEESRYSVWLDGMGQFGDQDSGSGFTSFDYRLGGGSVWPIAYHRAS